MPPAAADASLLMYRLKKLGGELAKKDIHLQVIASLKSTGLPLFDSLDASTLVAVRQDEQAFADWRAELRTAARVIESVPAEGKRFEVEAREVIADALGPRIHEVEQAISRSAVLRTATASQGLDLGIGAASMAVTSAALNAPLGAAGVASLGLAAVSRWVYATVFSRSPQGTRGIIATLARKR